MTSEADIQAAIVDYLRLVLPAGHTVECNYNNPRSAIAGAQLRRLGLNAGRPDLEIVGPHGSLAYIEVKAPKGRLSPAQKQYQKYCEEWRIPHCVARGIGDVQAFLADLEIQTRDAA